MNYDFIFLFRKKVIGLGFDAGNNSTCFGIPCNFFIEVTILFWTFGFEIDWEIEKKSKE